MKFEEKLTNEGLGKDQVGKERFESQFDLINHAIKVAEDMIGTGRDSFVRTESQSRATQILAEIDSGKDAISAPATSAEASEAFHQGGSSGYRDVRSTRKEDKALVE